MSRRKYILMPDSFKGDAVVLSESPDHDGALYQDPEAFYEID